MRKKSPFFCLCAALFFVAFSTLLVMSCATPKTTDLDEQHHAVSTTDSTSAHTAIIRQQLYVDSLFAAWTHYIQTIATSDELRTERVHETITTWLDSLGRPVTQEQRTIDRSETRQQQLIQQQQIDAQQREIKAAYQRIDSLYQLLVFREMAERNDSIAYHQQLGATQGISLWGGVGVWLSKCIFYIALVGLIILFCWLLKTHIQRKIKGES